MAFDKTIQLFIFGGNPNGRIMCELSNWNGRVCDRFECEKVKNTYARSEEKKSQCRQACESPEEFRMLCRAFYEKEKNMR